LEMHGTGLGYVGICRLNGDQVNVCGLFRRSLIPQEKGSRELLRGQPNTVLRARLATAAFDESSFCSVAGFGLHPHRASAQVECSIGDALTMIPPVTGNGMSMALEAAELAIEPLAAYSRGSITWTEARQAVAQACDQAFRRRLGWARWLQWLMFLPALRGRLGKILLASDWVWQTMFDRTR